MSAISRATSNRRLLKLADFLDALPPERFNYAHWVGADWKGAPDLSCGTTACALGWATTIPEFRRLGLRLTDGRIVALGVGADALTSEDAAVEVFGVTWEEARFLFDWLQPLNGVKSPSREAGPKEVAEHIRRFVRERAS